MSPPFPVDARTPVDVYKAGRLAAHMWRVDEHVSFVYTADHVTAGRQPVAFTLPVTSDVLRTSGMRLPPFFAGLLPEGETRRRELQRAFHIAEDDELGLLAIVGGDTVGDVQIVGYGTPPPDDIETVEDWSSVSFAALWRQLPGPRTRSSLPGVQPKMSARSRTLHGAAVGPVILKLPIAGWDGVLRNEELFMTLAASVGLAAADVEIVIDAEGLQALSVSRFDRSVGDDGSLRRHAQEDASQVLGLRPGQKYDPDARTVITALASRCAAPRLALRNLVHQLVYSYVIGNNDVHAKNLSIRQDPATGFGSVSPVYDVLHTWPDEGDHRFVPAIRPDGPHDAVSHKWWRQLADDIGLPARVVERVIDRVVGQVDALIAAATSEDGLPQALHRDVRRVLRRRARDLAQGR